MQMTYECDLTWDDLQGDDKVRRHCLQCDHDVYNLSGMSRQKAERLFAEHGVKPPCVRFVSVDGHIVHEGDPLSQLHVQRAGARKLVAAALVLHATSVFTFAPTEYWFIPFAGFFIHERGASTVGVPAPSRMEGPRIDYPADGRPECTGVSECAQRAAAAIAMADAYTTSDDPARAYLEYRELDRAHLYAGLGPGVAADTAALEDRLRRVEDEVNQQFAQGRVRLLNHTSRKNWGPASQIVRELRVIFPDPHSMWGAWVDKQERELKDAGHWVEPSGPTP